MGKENKEKIRKEEKKEEKQTLAFDFSMEKEKGKGNVICYEGALAG